MQIRRFYLTIPPSKIGCEEPIFATSLYTREALACILLIGSVVGEAFGDLYNTGSTQAGGAQFDKFLGIL